MITAIDTNIMSAIWDREPGSDRWVSVLGEAFRGGSLVVCGVVFAEALAHPRASEEFVRNFFEQTGIRIDFEVDEPMWVEIARRYAHYAQRRRRSSGEIPKRLLADYIVGSHALLRADRLLTLDTARYRNDFPELVLLGDGAP